jgi:hypothetical protein
MSEGGHVILFTGQSGIAARGCLARLNQHLDPQGEIISVEQRMAAISGRSFSEEILLEKIHYQYELWREAFKDILGDLNRSEFGKTVLLTLHGVYYHQDKREFVSPVDFKMLTELGGKVRMLIVFIDDIYDIYRRLTQDGEMYARVKELEPLEAVYASCFNLISILEWRQVEITVSRLIQQMLDVPMYIVATKHPAFMIARLISRPTEHLRVFYLGHPITRIREDAVKEIPDFTGELKQFCTKIIDKPDTVLFLPASIDELRIRKEGSTYLPDTTARWRLPYDKESCLCPSLSTHLEDVKPLDPLTSSTSPSPEVEMSVSRLMKLLSDYIGVQITSRDLSMVEQSKNGVIAYRPYFPHHLSGGVERELQHNYELSDKESSRRSIILSIVQDQAKARIEHFFTLMDALVENLEDADRESLHELCHQWIYDGKKIRIFSDDMVLRRKTPDIRKEVQTVLPKEYRFAKDLILKETSLRGGEMGEQEKQRRLAFKYIVDEVLKDALREYLISVEDYYKVSSPDDVEIDTILGSSGNNKEQEVK